MNEKLKALETVKSEIEKMKTKYETKAQKERAKVNDIYVTVCGEKCHTEDEINDWYANDYISCKQCDSYIEKLNAKKEKAGESNAYTPSERVVTVLSDVASYVYNDIHRIKVEEEEKRKRDERWEIAQQQGMSYKQWLDLEEVSRQSEEYEKLMGI